MFSLQRWRCEDVYSGNEMCRLLEGHGWSLRRIKGGHHIYGKPPVGARFDKIGDKHQADAYLDDVVHQMMDQDPERRHQSIDAIKQVLIGRKNDVIEVQKPNVLKQTVVPSVEQTAESTARHASELAEFHLFREQWRMTASAVVAATEAASEVCDTIEEICNRISNETANMKMLSQKPSGLGCPLIKVKTWSRQLHVQWLCNYSNSLRGSGLVCRLTSGGSDRDQVYDYDIGADRLGFWQLRGASEHYSSVTLADRLVKWLVETVIKAQPWNV